MKLRTIIMPAEDLYRMIEMVRELPTLDDDDIVLMHPEALRELEALAAALELETSEPLH
mgnify:CR=1 FL=1